MMRLSRLLGVSDQLSFAQWNVAQRTRGEQLFDCDAAAGGL